MITRFVCTTATIATLSVALLAQPSQSAPASDGPGSTVAPRAKVKLGVRTPATAVEGARYSVTVRPRGAKKSIRRVELQHQVEDVFGNPEWLTVKKAKGARVLAYRTVAGEEDNDRYRSIATLKKGRPTVSKVATVKVWHWYPLVWRQAYYKTNGISAHSYNQFSMNGSSYAASWYTYGSYRAWESRYTLGRKCSHMRGTFGVTDDSADGTSATIEVRAEGTKSVYVSPTLRPGVVMPRTFSVGNAYRISIIAKDTTDTESLGDVTSYPAIGDLQVLCHGIA